MASRKICVLGSFAFLALTATATQKWRVSLNETAISRNPSWAKNAAVRLAERQLTSFYELCNEISGKPAHTVATGGCQPSGIEDFLCGGQANFTCEIATVEFLTGTKEIEGAYWDSESGLYLAIDSKKIRGGLVSPYLGGKALTQLGRLERTGENTYTVSGNFSAIQGECSGSVRFNLTKLSDGNLLFEAVSPEEVFAIIFGSCRWKGTLTSRAELRQIHR